MTAGELRGLLAEYPDDRPVWIELHTDDRPEGFMLVIQRLAAFGRGKWLHLVAHDRNREVL
jgi:hypothetical protein